MQIKIITAPSEIISVAEAVEFARVDSYASESTTIATLITASRQMVEDYLQRLIGSQTVEVLLGQFPSAGRQAIALSSPLASITSVKYIDTSATEQTLAENTDYYKSVDSDRAEIIPVSTWPTAMKKANSVRIRCVAGYQDPGDSPILSAALPRTIRTAMLMQFTDLYENRGAQTEKPLTVNRAVENLLSPYRLEMGI